MLSYEGNELDKILKASPRMLMMMIVVMMTTIQPGNSPIQTALNPQAKGVGHRVVAQAFSHGGR